MVYSDADLAHDILEYSIGLKKGDYVLISYSPDAERLARYLIKYAYVVKAIPFVKTSISSVNRELFMGLTEGQITHMADRDAEQMSKMDAYISISAPSNLSELSDIPTDIMSLYSRIYTKKVHRDIRVNKTKWVGLRYPNKAMAQEAGMSLESFEDMYYKAVSIDYATMGDKMTPLVNLLNTTDKVRIIGNNTDITFSIKGIPAVKCNGKRNIPDGEVFTSPILDSAQGVIKFNVPTSQRGITFRDVELRLDKGVIVEATSSNTKALNDILDTDEGARRIGEFALGVNNSIINPINDILFDEKIGGSIHFTPGSSYKEAYNGNDSGIHWDMVLIQTEAYGGGEIYFDDVLVRRDGKFVLKALKPLDNI